LQTEGLLPLMLSKEMIKVWNLVSERGADTADADCCHFAL